MLLACDEVWSMEYLEYDDYHGCFSDKIAVQWHKLVATKAADTQNHLHQLKPFPMLKIK